MVFITGHGRREIHAGTPDRGHRAADLGQHRCQRAEPRGAARACPYLRRNFGLVFQDQKLLFDRSALENVLLPLAIVGMPIGETTHVAPGGAGQGRPARPRPHQPIALSGGEQQRLAIARAVVNRPAILLADEPTANLDSESAAGILDIFAAFHQVGVTVIIATHDPQWSARRRQAPNYGNPMAGLPHERLAQPAPDRPA